MEIGGYLQLDELKGREFYPDLIKVNLARTAMLWLMESRNIKKLLLPKFLCDSMYLACERGGYDFELYDLDENLDPVLDREMEKDEWLLIVNYYGQLTDEHIQALKDKYGRVMLDYTQSFFRKPLPGIDTIYSCRKFLGLSDGAYISTDCTLTGGKDADVSIGRMDHVLGRYEAAAGEFYGKMLSVADSFHEADIRTMSALTANLLKAIDYDRIIEARHANYMELSGLLPSDNPFTKTVPEAPFAYPWYCENGPALRKRLAKRSIFVPTNWSYLIGRFPAGTHEHDWSADILPLPVDQRYTPADMKYMAEIILEEKEKLSQEGQP